jgi:BlaI family transcriptional regulator, penicillinase repressor
MQITAAESQVMDALWRRGPLTFDEVLAEVTATQPWGRATVKTLVNRLLNKKAILSERQSGRHQYKALVERADYVDVESQGLLDRLFEGELTPLISHFAEYRKLKPEEIERLKRLIEEIEGDS